MAIENLNTDTFSFDQEIQIGVGFQNYGDKVPYTMTLKYIADCSVFYTLSYASRRFTYVIGDEA